MSFSGEIPIEPVKVTGFKLRSLSVMVRSSSFIQKSQVLSVCIKDCLLLTVTPPDATKSAFVGIREKIAVRLITDPWNEDGRGVFAGT